MSDTTEWRIGTVSACDAGFGFIDDHVFFTASICPGGTLPPRGIQMRYQCQPRLDLPMKQIATAIEHVVKEPGYTHVY